MKLTVKYSNRKAKLEWDSSTKVDFYRLKCNKGNGLNTIADNLQTTMYVDEPLEKYRTYYYIVCGVKNGLEAEWSGKVSVKAV